jgi:hypothetical protein
VRGAVVEALFDPKAPAGILMELSVSDEANRCGIPVQVVQCLGGDIVLGVARSPVDAIRASHRTASLRRFEPCPDMPKKILRTVLSRRVL